MTAFSRTFIRPSALFFIAFFSFLTSPAQSFVQQQKNVGKAIGCNEESLQPNAGGEWIITATMHSSNNNIAFDNGLADSEATQSYTDPACGPVVSIRASQTTICLGTGITFSATVANDGTNGVYKWKKNGGAVGVGTPFYTSSSFHNGDTVVCEYSCRTVCGLDTTVVSNTITVNVINDTQPTISIAATDSVICEGTLTTFTATAFYGNSMPGYQWQVNGNATGSNDTTYSASALSNGATVQCVLTISFPGCPATSVSSNIITMRVLAVTNPSVVISASATQICKGSTVTFTAVGNGGAQPNYQWQINGAVAGSGTMFTTASLQNGDKVACLLTIDPAAKCFTSATAKSTEILMNVSDALPPSVAVSASSLDVCAGSNISFAALAQNTGGSPLYQWQVNGGNVGANAPAYSNNNFANGDKISCAITASNADCPAVTTVVSNLVVVNVRDLPVVQFSPAGFIVKAGQQVRLNAVVTGGVASFEWQPASGLIDAGLLTPTTIPIFSPATYTLKVIAPNGCEAKKEIDVKLISVLYMPSAFTPNGDGNNDVFRIPPGVLIKLKEFAVFDRWGNKVFATTDSNNGWDGTYKGRLLASGTFVYLIQGDVEGISTTVKGTITLVR